MGRTRACAPKALKIGYDAISLGYALLNPSAKTRSASKRTMRSLMLEALARRAVSEISDTTTTSPFAPPGGVEGVHPADSTCNLRRTGEYKYPSAGPRCQPFGTVI